MMSIVVLMIITIIAGEAADLQTNMDSIEVASEIEICPYLENAEYEVTMKTSVSTLVGGCAHIHFNPSDVKSQLFRVYFGNKHHDGQHCIDRGMEFFHFYCLSKSPSRLENIISGRMYIRLYDKDVNKEGGQDRRCALYYKIADHDFLMTFVVMISSDSSCVGLSDTLYSTRRIPSHKEGSMLLIFNRTKSHSPLTPVATTTESMKSISNQFENFGYLLTPAAITTTESTQWIHDLYERRRYILQNFGYRTDPFWGTKNTMNHTSEKRELQMNDGDGRHGAVMNIPSYDGLQSAVNDKDVTMTTIKHQNWLSQPLAIDHTQVRRKRSKSNMMST